MKFAEKLRKERLSKNLSQEQLGEMIGISKRSIIKYENLFREHQQFIKWQKR